MGVIRIQTVGSFGLDGFEASAEEGGHANAIQRAIKFLVDRLPEAIEKDHKLHAKGEVPPRAWFGQASGG